LKHEIDPKKKTIRLVYGGISLSEVQKNLIREKSAGYSLEDAKIEFQQGFSFDQLTKKNTEVENLTSEINRLMILLKEKDELLEISSRKNIIGKQILDEIKILYPQINSCTYAESEVFSVPDSNPEMVQMIVFKTEGKNLHNAEKNKIENWIKARLKSDKLKIFFE
jgi:hypothetical protein